ncbi:MAG: secretin N-terminal domain-containing protein [Verrucomicrobiota bacterium]
MKLRIFRCLPLVAVTAAIHAQSPPQPATLVPIPSQTAPAQPSLPASTPQQAGTAPVAAAADTVNIQFPRTSIFDVLNYYESLTGRRLIRDSNLAGPEISIMVSQPVPKQEAIKLIESSLLLNGYSIVPVDDQTVKILGPSRAPRTEGLPLYIDSTALPQDGDRVVSFYKPLAFISPEEAMLVLSNVIQTNAFGMVAAVPNTNAIIITDKTPIIRKALGVLSLIDVEPAQVVTEFVPLQRANAERIVEILDQMFGKDDLSSKNSGPSANVQTPPGGQPVPAGGAGTSGARYENRLITGKAKFVADKRTNRILVVTRQENYRYVRDVITQLDAAGAFEQPFVRICNYVPVTDVFPVLSDMLAEAETEKKGGAAGAQPTPSNPFNNTNKSQNRSSTSGANSSGGGVEDGGDVLNETSQATPQSVTIGEIKLIADTSSNSIIVYGPPESKQRAKQILDLLDQRPKQVYLAVVIGQLNVTNSTDYGVQYLIRYQGASGNGLAAAVLNPLLFPNVTGTLPNPSSIRNPAALANGLGALSGLTIFGTIADSVDVYARFLESTGNFRTLSRPVVYTTNNRKATIFSGQRVPFPQSSLTTATGGGVNNNGTSVASSVAYQNVVLKLEVIPLINSDREVNLVIAQKNDTLGAEKNISGNLVNIINTQEIKTSVRVPNGSTVVLGGLITETKKRDQAGIPYLSRIPVVGSLLGGKTSNSVDRNELIVMIQPVVVDTNEEMMKASAYEGDRTALGKDGQIMTAPLAEQVREPAPWKPPYAQPPRPTPTPKPRKN